METKDLGSWFIAATVLSTTLAFITSSLRGYRSFGGRYMGVVWSSWGRILITLLPIFIYTGISVSSSGWDKLFQSAEVAMGAFLILLAANQELGCGLAVTPNFPVERYKVGIISAWSLIWLCVALLTVALIFQAESVPIVTIIWQFVVLIIAILTYFCSASVVKLLAAGHVSNASRSNK